MQPRYTSARPTRPIYHAGCCLHLTEIILTGGRKKERKVLSFKGEIHGVQTENMEHVVVPFQLVVYALWSYHRGSMCLSCTTKSLCLRDHDEEGVTETSCSTKKDNSGREKCGYLVKEMTKVPRHF